jgi:hypothetical protein
MAETKPRPRPRTVAQWKEARRERYRRAGNNGGFRVLPIKVIDSDAFNELSKSAKIVLILSLCMLDYWHKKHNGKLKRETSVGPLRNEGRFSLPNHLLKERGIKGEDTIARVRRELVAAGFWDTVETGTVFNSAVFHWSDRWTQYNQRSIEVRKQIDTDQTAPGYCLYPNITKYNENLRASKDAHTLNPSANNNDAQEDQHEYRAQIELFPEVVAM